MKKYSTSTTLVIVESPAKCKKIESYLGPGYKCLASFGHLRELSSISNIDISNNFTPKYTIIDNTLKQKQIALLKNEIALANYVLLATDDDREGEAIAWHICMLFNLSPEKTKRIIFHEITESALHHAVNNPTVINMNIVHAQQTRQILDLLVGFKISPILWKYITRNAEKRLSAGRCQTPALKLIYENQIEIDNHPGHKVYNTTGYFQLSSPGSSGIIIPFDLNKHHESEDLMVDFLDTSADYDYVINCASPVKVFKQPPQPLSTSSLQQAASNELHISPKETMQICQSLYEAGYITYMRTDSQTYCTEFKESTKKYIVKTFDERYVHPELMLVRENKEDNKNNQTNNQPSESIVKTEKVKKTEKTLKTEKKTKGVKKVKIEERPETEPETDSKAKIITQNNEQTPHEAIRPTDISLKDLPDKVDSREKRMYKLIWQTTLESCMSPASLFTIKATIQAPENSIYTCTGEIIDFSGWLAVANKNNLLDNQSSKYYQLFANINQQNSTTQNNIKHTIKYNKVLSTLVMKETKQHYTEARLVKLLEDNGIGRPSTFSSLVDKIQERGYVKKQDIVGKTIDCKDYEMINGEMFEIEKQREFGNEKGKLIIQPVGILVMNFLDKHFIDLFNYDYTNQMENSLDDIAQGKIVWQTVCEKCLEQVDKLIFKLETQTDERKLEIKIDTNHFYIVGKHGPVIKCIENGLKENIVTFKPVKPDIDLQKLERGEYKIEDILSIVKNNEVYLGKYQDEDLFIKCGKFGMYASWGKETKPLKCFGNRPIENITVDEVIELLEKEGNIVRVISDNISIRKSKRGDYLYFKSAKMKKPQFLGLKDCKEDYINCDVELLIRWAHERYNIF